MFQRILVPLDGSAGAERAIPMAARIAQALGSSITLLQVVVPPVRSGKFSAPIAYPRMETDEELAEASEYLKGVAQSNQLATIKTDVQACVGAPAPTILAAIQASQATLLVLCSHGSTGLKHWMLGSVAQKVIRHAPIPVLVLREGEGEAVRTVEQPMRVLIALDGSPLAEALLEPVAAMIAALAQATARQGLVQLVRVVDIPTAYGKFRTGVDAMYEAEMRAEAKQQDEHYLHMVAKRFTEGDLAKYHLTVKPLVLINPDVATALVQQAEQDQVDFIALATHGRGGIQHWALGSITERVLQTTKVPLFILRSQPDSHGPVANAEEEKQQEHAFSQRKLAEEELWREKV